MHSMFVFDTALKIVVFLNVNVVNHNIAAFWFILTTDYWRALQEVFSHNTFFPVLKTTRQDIIVYFE